jgi:hypothetical protein
MALSSHEMNLLFRDKAKVVPLQKFISLTSPSLVGHSKPLLEGFRKMVKGGHIIDLIYGVKKDGKENKDIKEEMTSIRRLKFILSQLYHSLVELESISHSYNTNNETPKLTEPSTGSNFEMAWNSSRKRYFEYALGLLNEKDRADFFKERKQRIKKLNDTKVVYIKESMKG